MTFSKKSPVLCKSPGTAEKQKTGVWFLKVCGTVTRWHDKTCPARSRENALCEPHIQLGAAVCRGGILVVVWPSWFNTLDDSFLSCVVWWFSLAFSVLLETFGWTPAALLSAWIPKIRCFKKRNPKLVKSLDTGEMTESPTSRPTCPTSLLHRNLSRNLLPRPFLDLWWSYGGCASLLITGRFTGPCMLKLWVSVIKLAAQSWVILCYIILLTLLWLIRVSFNYTQWEVNK